MKHTIVLKRPKIQTLKKFIATNENLSVSVWILVFMLLFGVCRSGSRMHRRHVSCTRKHHVRRHNMVIAQGSAYSAGGIRVDCRVHVVVQGLYVLQSNAS